MAARRKIARVRIPKDTVLTGTFAGGEKFAGRTYEVDVMFADKGYVPNNPWDVEHAVGRAGSVTWPGAGGYWHEADVEDIVVLSGSLGFDPADAVTRAELRAARERIANGGRD